MVIDGTAAPAFRADVGLSGGQVTAVGALDRAHGATEVDAVRLNTATLLPLGAFGFEVLGGARRARREGGLAGMRAMVERGVVEGAAGLLSGLEYAPGAQATASELAALCAPVAAAGLPYVTH